MGNFCLEKGKNNNSNKSNNLVYVTKVLAPPPDNRSPAKQVKGSMGSRLIIALLDLKLGFAVNTEPGNAEE